MQQTCLTTEQVQCQFCSVNKLILVNKKTGCVHVHLAYPCTAIVQIIKRYVVLLSIDINTGVVYSIRPEDTDVHALEAKVTSFLKVKILHGIIFFLF